ncbi:hypothetical protein D3C85_1364600 [compost metagenome]
MHTGFTHGGFLDTHRIYIQCDIGLLHIAQCASDRLADTTIATDHCMAMQVGGERADFLEFRFFIGFAVQACRQVRRGAQ